MIDVQLFLAVTLLVLVIVLAFFMGRLSAHRSRLEREAEQLEKKGKTIAGNPLENRRGW